MGVFKKIFGFLLVLWGLSLQGQECPEVLYPQDGESNVPVDAIILWTDTDIDLITSWAISIGLTPGGEEIVNQQSTGKNPQFALPCGIPNDTTIYVELYIFTLTGGFIPCSSFSFTTEAATQPPACRSLTFPADGAQDVFLGTNLNWECSPSATGYFLSVGTSPGNYDILLNEELGADELSYDFLDDNLPENQDIYVQVVPFNEEGNADDGSCRESVFRTGEQIVLPECTFMLSPQNGAQNVELNTTLTWNSVENATGYRVFLGTTPNEYDILGGETPFQNNSTAINFLEPNTIYFIRIVPINEAGDAIGCLQAVPETFSTILGCTYTLGDGTIIDERPTLTFPSTVGSCEGSGRVQVTVTDEAEGYRWFEIPEQGPEVLLDTSPTTTLPGEGEYRVEIYNILEDPLDPDITFECASFQIFTVTQSEPPKIDRTDVQLGAGVISIEVFASGLGDYEYALGELGPYQDSNRFTNLPIDNYRVFVRDKNGCGLADALVEPDLTLDGFPKFFTPNGDGINDTWQFIPPPSGLNPIRQLHIFDRYGKLLAQIDPRSQGWNGTFNGRPLPASDYWFRAVNDNNQVLQGHFSLKR